MITASDAFARARGAFFRIPIERDSGRDWWWGTGFFISSAGHALTAYHNLPAIVSAARHGQVQGADANGQPFILDFIPMDGDKARDIALLRLPADDRRSFSSVSVAALPGGLSSEEPIRFWAGRAVLVCGFPCNEERQEEDAISGHVRGDGPIGMVDEKDEDRVAHQVERLKIVPDRSTDLPGISGGPVIDLVTGLVVAVVGACDWDKNLIYTSEITRTAPVWPHEVRHGLETLENTPIALRDRANGLLEIPRRPWNPDRLPPGALLRADCAAAVPFHGRDDESADLEAWSAADEHVGIRLYTAEGGMGKTRLFLELCERLKTRGWRVGFLLGEAAHASADLWAALISQAPPLLVVVDYANLRFGELVPLLRSVDQVTAGRVRIILLARAAGDWWEDLKREGHGVGDLLVGPATRWHELRPLAMSEEQRRESYWTAAQTFADALGKPMPAAAPDDLSARHFERVLLLHMSALAAIDGVAVKGDQGILNYVLDRERRFWSKQVEAMGLSRALGDAVAQAMTLVTLGGGAKDARHARLILRETPLLKDQPEIVRRKIATLLHEAYPGVQFIEPMLPDLLGELLVQVELGKDDGTLLEIVFGSPETRSERLPS